MAPLKIIECPRDAMQGWKHLIDTETKIKYINALLQVGFDTIDFGSFVSPKAIPQMADTAAVLEGISKNGSATKLLAIVANVRGAETAVQQEVIDYLGFPFSISPTFQMRNTNSSIEASLQTVAAIQELCRQHNKQLVVYISMGFGNPYGDAYDESIVMKWIEGITSLGINIVSLADTVGIATPEQVSRVVSTAIDAFPAIETGVHLHSAAHNWQPKLAAAYEAGCRRFDGALKGIGGCPMAKDDLVGNMNTEWMLDYFDRMNQSLSINREALQTCSEMANKIFTS